MYPKCPEIKCDWHMGFGYDNYTYLNGTCYHSNGLKNMFCPENKESPIKTNKPINYEKRKD